MGSEGVISPSGWTMFSVQEQKTFSHTVPTPLNGVTQPVTTERMQESYATVSLRAIPTVKYLVPVVTVINPSTCGIWGVGVSCGVWACPVGCGRVLWGVGVSCGVWACPVGCGCVLWGVGVSCGVWACLVGCGRVLWGVGVSCGVWACLVGCGRVLWGVYRYVLN